MIVVTCSCGARFKAENEYAGRMSRCTKCGKSVRIPSTHSDALLADARKPAAPAEQLTSVEFTRQKSADRLYLKCGGCGGKLSVRVTSVGRKGTCPHCHKKFIVPQAPPPDVAFPDDSPGPPQAGPPQTGQPPAGPRTARRGAQFPAHRGAPDLDLPGLAARGAGGRSDAGPDSSAAAADDEELPTLDYADISESPVLFAGGSGRLHRDRAGGGSGAIEIGASGELRIEHSGEIAPAASKRSAAPTPAQTASAVPGGVTCPCCGGALRAGAKICVACGINVETGRSLVISQEDDLDEIYAVAETLITKFSWLAWTGFIPIASEAYGGRKPHVVRGIVLLTIAFSLTFLAFEWTGSPRMHSFKNLMLWSSDAPPPETIRAMYLLTDYGDFEAFHARYVELARQRAKASSRPGGGGDGADGGSASGAAEAAAASQASGQSAAATASSPVSASQSASESPPDEASEASADSEEFLDNLDLEDDALTLAAFHSLSPEQRSVGEFRWWQLVTHQFLHGGLGHLIGNLIFLWVFGSRINALIGNVMTAILYPLLGVAAAVAHLRFGHDLAGVPMLGASGAIMGLAGMYFVLFPLNRVHMAAWLRLGIMFGFRLKLWLFALRGVWVVLFYIAFDVLATALQSDDGTAHSAHLGGFVGGAALALILLFARLVNARGSDLLSVILGRRAWALVGRPNRAG